MCGVIAGAFGGGGSGAADDGDGAEAGSGNEVDSWCTAATVGAPDNYCW